MMARKIIAIITHAVTFIITSTSRSFHIGLGAGERRLCASRFAIGFPACAKAFLDNRMLHYILEGLCERHKVTAQAHVFLL